MYAERSKCLTCHRLCPAAALIPFYSHWLWHAGYEWKIHCLIYVSCSAWRHWNECQTNINGRVCLLQLSPVATRLLNVVECSACTVHMAGVLSGAGRRSVSFADMHINLPSRLLIYMHAHTHSNVCRYAYAPIYTHVPAELQTKLSILRF